jgi:anaerobic selenocysteine-containing dehydrogenase
VNFSDHHLYSRLSNKVIDPIVWINEENAQRLNIHDGNEVVLYNELGEVHVKAVVNEKVRKGVLWVPRPLTGSEGNPLNVLAPSTPQIIGGGPNFNSIKGKIRHEHTIRHS